MCSLNHCSDCSQTFHWCQIGGILPSLSSSCERTKASVGVMVVHRTVWKYTQVLGLKFTDTKIQPEIDHTDVCAELRLCPFQTGLWIRLPPNSQIIKEKLRHKLTVETAEFISRIMYAFSCLPEGSSRSWRGYPWIYSGSRSGSASRKQSKSDGWRWHVTSGEYQEWWQLSPLLCICKCSFSRMIHPEQHLLTQVTFTSYVMTLLSSSLSTGSPALITKWHHLTPLTYSST